MDIMFMINPKSVNAYAPNHEHNVQINVIDKCKKTHTSHGWSGDGKDHTSAKAKKPKDPSAIS